MKISRLRKIVAMIVPPIPLAFTSDQAYDIIIKLIDAFMKWLDAILKILEKMA